MTSGVFRSPDVSTSGTGCYDATDALFVPVTSQPGGNGRGTQHERGSQHDALSSFWDVQQPTSREFQTAAVRRNLAACLGEAATKGDGSAPSPDTETRLNVLEDTVCATAAAMSTLQKMFNCSMLDVDRNNVQQHEAVSSTPLAREEPQYSRHLTESVNNEKHRSRRRHRSRSSSQETAPSTATRIAADVVVVLWTRMEFCPVEIAACQPRLPVEVEAAVVAPQHRNVAAVIPRMEVVHPRSCAVARSCADAVDIEITPRHRRALDRSVVA